MAQRGGPSSKQKLLEFGLGMAYLGVSIVGSGLLMRWLLGQIDPSRQQAKKAAEAKKKMLQQKFGCDIPTNMYEDIIAQDVVNPNEIDVGLDDIGGLENIKEALEHKVIAPLQKPELFRSSLLKQTKGILLYGPPGTGKTMLAKALARESGANFVNIRASGILSKWFGDTQKLVAAIFTFAWKIQPCIIFIDEVDSMLGRRKDHEHEAVTSLKTEFMQHWDGFLTSSRANILVLAATNRPYDLDEAVLRRFAAQFEVPLPDEKQRAAILRLVLVQHTRDLGTSAVARELLEVPSKALEHVARLTEGCSGSDLREVCAQAACLPVHEVLEEEHKWVREHPTAAPGERELMFGELSRTVRPIGLSDFDEVMRTFRPAVSHAEQYRFRSGAGANGSSNSYFEAMNAALLRGLNLAAEQAEEQEAAPSLHSAARARRPAAGAPTSNGALPKGMAPSGSGSSSAAASDSGANGHAKA